MDTLSDFIYLISCVVNGEKPDPERCSGMDLEEIYSQSIRHSLSVMTAAALEQVIELPFYLKEAKNKAIRKLALMDIERTAILGEMERRGIWYMPLKGVVMRSYYPKTSMREMVDNDILCDGARLDEIRDIMLSRGYTCKSHGKIHHDVYSIPPLLEFEMHHTLFDDRRLPKVVAYYENIREKLKKDDGKLYGLHMTDEDFYIYMICHLYKHYTNCGTGIRSVLDIFLFNRKERESMDQSYIHRELDVLGLVTFERDMRELAEKLFTRRELTENETRELEFLFDSGSHGTRQNRISIRMRSENADRSRLRYYLGRVFISGENLRRGYPFFYRHKYLYPLLFIYRPFHALANPKKIAKEIKYVNEYSQKDNLGSYNDSKNG